MSLFNRKKKSTVHSAGFKKVFIVTGLLFAFIALAPVVGSPVLDSALGIETAYAAESSFSKYWKQEADGSWKVYDSSGNIVKNVWLCDDAVQSNGQDVWYLLDADGNMITAGLVQDQTGNIYSLETNHNGYYGMLRYKSGVYDGVKLDLEGGHAGGFAKIKNQEGIAALQAKYGLTQVSISNANCVYTSSFASGTATPLPTTDPVVQLPDESPTVIQDAEYSNGGYWMSEDTNVSSDYLEDGHDEAWEKYAY